MQEVRVAIEKAEALTKSITGWTNMFNAATTAQSLALGGLEGTISSSTLGIAMRGNIWGNSITRDLYARGANRAFYSGKGSGAWARKSGYQTIGQTNAGRNLAKPTADMPLYPGSQAYYMWARLSNVYAKGARGPVHVYQNANLGVDLRSIWRKYEYPYLIDNPNVTLIYHY